MVSLLLLPLCHLAEGVIPFRVPRGPDVTFAIGNMSLVVDLVGTDSVIWAWMLVVIRLRCRVAVAVVMAEVVDL